MTINQPCQLRWVQCGVGTWYIASHNFVGAYDVDPNNSNVFLEIIQLLLWLVEITNPLAIFVQKCEWE
jgi:hypothetical protein